jgi:hypothetical protein
MSYLENPICKLDAKFNIDLKNKKNILSISFFKMYNGGYKNFKLYIDGFIQLHKIVLEEKIYNFTIRIFMDNSIYLDKELMSMIEGLERVEIVVYHCEKYLETDHNYHIGLFGTMVRFFPMFDFPNNDANIVMISDMDDYKFFNENVEVLTKLNKKLLEKMYILKITSLSKNVRFNYNDEYHGHITPYCIAPKFISFKKLDFKIIIDYFKNYGEKNIPDIIKIYGTKSKLNTLYSKESINKNKNFIYGVDENFLNFYLNEYIIDNNIPYAINFSWSIDSVLYQYKNYVLPEDNSKFKLITYILEYLLERLNIKYNKKDNFFKKYKLVNNIIIGNNTELKKKLKYFYYKMFLYFYNNTNYKFLYSKKLYQLIKDYDLFGVYSFYGTIYYEDKNKYTFEFEKKEEFNKEEKDKLLDFSKKHANIFIK